MPSPRRARSTWRRNKVVTAYWIGALIGLGVVGAVLAYAISAGTLDAVGVAVAGGLLALFGFAFKKLGMPGSLDRFQGGGVGMEIAGGLLVVAAAIGAVLKAIR